ncbi:uncharacterized protein FA14DRAFT_187655 [Meira miltonrushii]|uniref:Uncharacterized protein n=1 Tax=Meira miltonrushii TaxID=1280837 RepID=A0A316VIX7_9BASI|nr:uncharacterized protein FA14DRAFT_187655 [Meira miltonrushii]PWN37562.1 hypothetical protein FA14DRAFT_187655 [Meira miltonrushii]
MLHRVRQESAEQSQQKEVVQDSIQIPHRIHQEAAPDTTQNSSRVSGAVSTAEMVQDSIQDATQDSSRVSGAVSTEEMVQDSTDGSGASLNTKYHTEFIKRLLQMPHRIHLESAE